MSTKKAALASTAIVLSSDLVKKTNKNEGVLKLVETAIRGAKTMLQSIQELEKSIAKAATACVQHGQEHGDVMPAHRLVMGLRELNHPATTRLSLELVAWFRANSPIRWDSKGKPGQAKEGDEGYKPYNDDVETAEGFYETGAAKRAREAADTTHKNALKPADAQMMLSRIKGIQSWFDRMIEGKDERPIKKGEKAKMERILEAVQGAVRKTVPELVEEEKKAA